MNYRVKNKIIEAICKGQALYVKDTGIKVSVDYYGTDTREFRNRNQDKREFCNVEFVSTPNNAALRLFEKFNIKKNSHSKTMELDGVIDMRHLSLTPFESKAGKLLYGKKKR